MLSTRSSGLAPAASSCCTMAGLPWLSTLSMRGERSRNPVCRTSAGVQLGCASRAVRTLWPCGVCAAKCRLQGRWEGVDAEIDEGSHQQRLGRYLSQTGAHHCTAPSMQVQQPSQSLAQLPHLETPRRLRLLGSAPRASRASTACRLPQAAAIIKGV